MDNVNIEDYYDNLITSEEIDVVSLITSKAPEDSLLACASPDGDLIAITGSPNAYSSPEAVLYNLLLNLSNNKNLTVSEILYHMSIDIKYVPNKSEIVL